jgi:phospholipase C
MCSPKTTVLAAVVALFLSLPWSFSCSGVDDDLSEGDEADETGHAVDVTPAPAAALPDPAASGIEHVVVVMMENRSFDHMLGWVKGADGRQGGLTFADESGALFGTHRLAPDFQGCAHPDPDHSYAGGRTEYNGGASDGWLRAGSNDQYSIGYYTEKDLAFFSRAAKRWETLDHYFAAIMAETFPNRIYMHAAQTDRLENTLAISTLPTIWDRLAGAGLTGRYYYSDLPLLALWGPKYLPISRPIAEFVADAAAGTLPEVAFVDPRFLGEDEGLSGDDHPHADIRNGEAFLGLIYNAVIHSPDWQHTVLVINYDEWGGFFDHVPPPSGPIPPADQAAGATDGLFGFRTPAMIIAPWARTRVSHETFDHTSVLKMIEWRWGLEPLTVRDASANNLADALDFSRPDARTAKISVPLGPFGAACTSFPIPDPEEISLAALEELATLFGWPIPTATEADLAADLDRQLEP